MEDLEQECFLIISNVGSARSYYMEAIYEARKGKFDHCEKLFQQGDDCFLIGHQSHLRCMQLEANGKLNKGLLLMMHAEDQLMSAEMMKMVAQEFILNFKETTRIKLELDELKNNLRKE